MHPPDLHYCKHCRRWFAVQLAEKVTGDFFLECPSCQWRHYRHFEKGEAIHCDIFRAHDTPVLVKGR
jgi:hypothetical protein